MKSSLNSVFLLLLLLCFASCERRSLEDALPPDPTPKPESTLALIPMHIDWSQSKLVVEKIHRTSIWVFSHQGKAPVEYLLEGDVSNTTLKLPVGSYSLLVFNETIDNDDWRSISFSGTDAYETFTAYARPDTKNPKQGYSDEIIALPPDALAVWSLDLLEVTPEMVTVTQTRAALKANHRAIDKENQAIDKATAAVDAALAPFTQVTPLPMTRIINIEAYVFNLSSAFSVTAHMQGVTQGVVLATGKPLEQTVTHRITLNGREYDTPDKKSGTTKASFLAFSMGTQVDNNNKLHLEFQLTNGESAPSKVFDVTTQMNGNQEEEIYISVGSKDPEKPEDPDDPQGDRPIVLPDLDNLPEVGVDDWEDNDIDIN